MDAAERARVDAVLAGLRRDPTAVGPDELAIARLGFGPVPDDDISHPDPLFA